MRYDVSLQQLVGELEADLRGCDQQIVDAERKAEALDAEIALIDHEIDAVRATLDLAKEVRNKNIERANLYEQVRKCLDASLSNYRGKGTGAPLSTLQELLVKIQRLAKRQGSSL